MGPLESHVPYQGKSYYETGDAYCMTRVLTCSAMLLTVLIWRIPASARSMDIVAVTQQTLPL